MAQRALVDAYDQFLETARQYVCLETESDYNEALVTLEDILEASEDTQDNSLNPLIDMISRSIAAYEEKDLDIAKFVSESEDVPCDVALLKSLMRSHNLTGVDLPEIGNKSMVSKVLHGHRKLQRNSIEQLSARFGLRPAMFFGG